jgi:SAM-dependent methyltransferase
MAVSASGGSGDPARMEGELRRWLLLLPRCRHRTRLLDLGCGQGTPLAREAANEGYSITGVDILWTQVEAGNLRSRHLRTIRFVCDDLRHLKSLPNEWFCGILCFHSVHMVPRPDFPLVAEAIQRVSHEASLLWMLDSPGIIGEWLPHLSGWQVLWIGRHRSGGSYQSAWLQRFSNGHQPAMAPLFAGSCEQD